LDLLDDHASIFFSQGQTVFDVADTDVLPVLEELKKKQTNWKKDPEMQAVLMRRPQAPIRRR
jgi:hypothetical protein